MTETAYARVYFKEASAAQIRFGIRIEVAGFPSDLLESPAAQCVFMKAVDDIEKVLLEPMYANDPAIQKRRKQDRAELTSLFPGKIFVEEIPNGYCSLACCKQLPWFRVWNEHIGPVEIGWRKRVIEIRWAHSELLANADTLFPGEDVTKFEKAIHAWGVEKAQEYVNALLQAMAKQVAAV